MNSNHRVRGRSRELYPSGHRFRGPSTSSLSGRIQLSCTVTGTSALLLFTALFAGHGLQRRGAARLRQIRIRVARALRRGERPKCEACHPSARRVLGCRLLMHRPGGVRALNLFATAERVAPAQGCIGQASPTDSRLHAPACALVMLTRPVATLLFSCSARLQFPPSLR